MVLRMRHRIAAPERRIALHVWRTRGAKRVPYVLVEREIEIGQNHAPVGKMRDAAQQLCNGRSSGRHPGGYYRVQRRTVAPGTRGMMKQTIAPLGRVDRAQFFQLAAPSYQHPRKDPQRVLPVSRQIG